MDRTRVFAEIQELVHEVYWRADFGDVRSEVALASQDIVVIAPGGGANGVAEYQALLERRRTAGGQSFHVITNVRLCAIDSDRVEFCYLITNYLRDRPGVGPGDHIALAQSYDVAVPDGDTFRIARREVRALLVTGNPGFVHD